MAEATTDLVRLPPAPRIPALAQGIGFVTARDRAIAAVARRHGSEFTLNLPIFGPTVVVSDPRLVKEIFTMSTDLIGRAGTLGEVLGPGSTFSLDGTAHRQRRKLLVPPFHGRRMQDYEHIIEEEVMREVATWPEGEGFATWASMMRITLNAILRAVFGADGAELEELRELLPPMVLRASRLAVMPPAARRDYGPWSPWGRVEKLRRRYDAVIARLIAEARRDPAFTDRNDVLAMMLQARYQDCSPISDDHVADELLTLLTAGHETTATTLVWAVERIRRHPRLLTRLTDEADAGDSDLLQATIFEVQRTRPVINGTARLTRTRIRLGEWVIPERYVILVSISLAHASEGSFADGIVQPRPFRRKPAGHARLDSVRRRHPTLHRRCVRQHGDDGDNANLLREFEFGTTYARDEPAHSRGVATAPGHGGRAVVYRCAPRTLSSVPAAAAEVSA
jgi:cytochrome P450